MDYEQTMAMIMSQNKELGGQIDDEPNMHENNSYGSGENLNQGDNLADELGEMN